MIIICVRKQALNVKERTEKLKLTCTLSVKHSGLLVERKVILLWISCMEHGENSRFCCDVPLADMM